MPHRGASGRRSPVVRLRLPTFGPTHMVLTLAILLLGLFAYAFLQTAAQSYRLRLAERELVMEVQTLREQKAELEGLTTYLESDEYIEAFARQQLRAAGRDPRPGRRARSSVRRARTRGALVGGAVRHLWRRYRCGWAGTLRGLHAGACSPVSRASLRWGA